MDILNLFENLPNRIFEDILVGFLSATVLTVIGALVRWAMVSLRLTASTTQGLWNSLKQSIKAQTSGFKGLTGLPETFFSLIFTICMFLIPFIVSLYISVMVYYLMFFGGLDYFSFMTPIFWLQWQFGTDAAQTGVLFTATRVSVVVLAAVIRYMPVFRPILTWIGYALTWIFAAIVGLCLFAIVWGAIWGVMAAVQYAVGGAVEDDQLIVSAVIAAIVALIFVFGKVKNVIVFAMKRAADATGYEPVTVA